MQHYEVLFILPGTLSENEVAPVAAKIKETIEQGGGKEITISDMGKSRLAYPMRHIRYGYFHIGRFMAEPSAMPPLQDKLRLMSEPLRIIVTVVDPAKKSMTNRIDVITDVRDPRVPVAGAAEKEREMMDIGVKEMSERPKAATEKTATETKPENIRLEDIDKKLDELLGSDIANV